MFIERIIIKLKPHYNKELNKNLKYHIKIKYEYKIEKIS